MLDRFFAIRCASFAQVVEVAPEFGALVLFDSASGPHEVLPTEAGSRVAAAGWFHEPTREPPDWYGEDS